MLVKPELLDQIKHAVENEGAADLQWAEMPEDQDESSLKAAATSRIQSHFEMHKDSLEATNAWDRAETALKRTLKSKREKEPELVLPSFEERKPQSAPGGSTELEEVSRPVARSPVLERARLLRCKAAEAGKKLKDHSHRRLRVKINEVLREVHRRQNLRRHQEKVRGFREARQRLGRGCSASLGDADAIALGLGAEVATPRRGCILDSLSLEELALVRSNPRWYLEAFLESDFEDEEFSGNREVLIDFFTPARKDKHVSIECYAQRLRARLALETQDSQGMVSESRSWRASRSTGNLSTGVGLTETSWMMSSTSSLRDWSTSSRRQPIRDDKASPTMQKVWEKHRRKEERDAQILEARRLAAEDRMVKNAFKVSQQLRDYESTQSKYKELHAERMAEALQRRSARDAAAQERLGFMDELKLQKMRRAMEQAEEQLELKQQRASECLELWREGLRRCRRHQRMEERKVLASHRSSQEAYLSRLIKVGRVRSEKFETQAQKNDKLKSRIQISLMEQLEEQRKLDCDQKALATEEKLEAARFRRYQRSNKYNFLERAMHRVPYGSMSKAMSSTFA